mmetsp:Transcript_10200/g.24521  ORF Transcript_10200/g.24521 Transcript_10200/m.24521 type:complete len:204 (+) Transcript_10200:982-1593(+)
MTCKHASWNALKTSMISGCSITIFSPRKVLALLTATVSQATSRIFATTLLSPNLMSYTPPASNARFKAFSIRPTYKFIDLGPSDRLINGTCHAFVTQSRPTVASVDTPPWNRASSNDKLFSGNLKNDLRWLPSDITYVMKTKRIWKILPYFRWQSNRNPFGSLPNSIAWPNKKLPPDTTGGNGASFFAASWIRCWCFCLLYIQ